VLEETQRINCDASRYVDAVQKPGTWKMNGRLKDKQTIQRRLDKAPEVINRLVAGGNIAKRMIEF
jgi:NADPH-dependent curcumin reductase CurA